MPDPTNEEKIVENALSPKRASNDNGSMEQHSIQDQILADEYQAKKRSARRGFGGLRLVKFVPPSAID